MQFSIDTSRDKTVQSKILTLTPLGKQKVEALDGQGEAFAILSTLAERGPSTLQEVATESGIGKDKCKFILKNLLIPQGFVSIMKTGGDQPYA